MSGDAVMSGVVIWFTGLPASGKTTLAKRVAEQLRASGRPHCLLDSDEVRRTVTPHLGYSVAERNSFYDQLARMAGLLARQGQVVLVAATANRRRFRVWAREMAPRYFEVYVNTPVQECRTRDPKGLYKRAAATGSTAMPGGGAEYEVPEAPDIEASGGEDDVVPAILALLDKGGAGSLADADAPAAE